MPKQIEFFFDYVSPYSHVGNAAVKQMVARSGAKLIYRPMFLGGVMQATGNRPPGTVEAKAKYMGQDLPRCVNRYGLVLKMNPHFPMNTRKLLRATIGLADTPDEQTRFIDACFELCWALDDPIDPSDEAQLAAPLAARGFDLEDVLARATDEANTAALRANTDEAVARGVFGSPTFFVGDAMFFGHDRLDFAEELVAA